ncbi:unnamed protein product [Darwinula stevensoni]|uniref:Guanylate cyclase domain-containing protein n=1 Tax=Darwinula stevensoni TaxID=69355 RepID=A0A7R9A4N1_9CRUS|nr:unnamed protein product [Darwinula stevensoni]CAG0890357.1 unnamed protein product [Darwinula stevensoni]
MGTRSSASSASPTHPSLGKSPGTPGFQEFRTDLLAYHVPDFVIGTRKTGPHTVHLDGTCMFIDISGDAVFAIWEARGKNWCQLVHVVICCAMQIQATCANWKTSFPDIKLNVKIGIAAGPITLIFFGNKNFKSFIECGPAVDAVNKAESQCMAGEVVLSHQTWIMFCLPIWYNHEICADRKHVKIKHIQTNPMKIELQPGELQEREAVSFAVKNNMWRKLVPYVIPPVLKQVMDGLEGFMAEMRQATIMFIKLEEKHTETDDKSIILTATFNIIVEHMVQNKGMMTKVFMFDKGMLFLCVFGLPGYKQTDECAVALRTGHAVKSDLEKLGNIESASIGIATGLTYCGVVGHAYRHEYTVIGRKVNLAARLMTSYPSKLTCDYDTHNCSKLPPSSFQKLELIPLKGFADVGPIYEFLGVIEQSTTDLAIRSFRLPMIDRHKLIMVVLRQLLTRIPSHFVIIYEGSIGMGKTRLLDSILLEVTFRNMAFIGISVTHDESPKPYHVLARILLQVAKATNSRLMIVVDNAHSMDRETWEWVEHVAQLKPKLFIVVLTLDSVTSRFIHKAAVEEFLKSDLILRMTIDSLTNEVLATLACQFLSVAAVSWKIVDLLQKKSDGNPGWCEEVLKQLRDRDLVTIEPLDAHPGSNLIFGDTHYLMERQRVRAEDTMSSLHAPQFTLTENERKFSFIPYESEESTKTEAAETRKNLEGKQVPLKESKLQEKEAEAQPGFPPESLVNTLQDYPFEITHKAEDLFLKCDERSTYKEDELVEVMSLPEKLDNMVSSSSLQEAAFVSEGVTLENLPFVGDMKDMVLSRLDELSHFQLFYLKCAAVLGDFFNVFLLRKMLSDIPDDKFIRRFSGIRAISLGDRTNIGPPPLMAKLISDPSNRLMCDCIVERGGHPMDMEVYCPIFRFTNPLLREAAYEILTDDQRKSLHIEAANILETFDMTCKDCGGEEYVSWKEAKMDRGKETRYKISQAPWLEKGVMRNKPYRLPRELTPQGICWRRGKRETVTDRRWKGFGPRILLIRRGRKREGRRDHVSVEKQFIQKGKRGAVVILGEQAEIDGRKAGVSDPSEMPLRTSAGSGYYFMDSPPGITRFSTKESILFEPEREGGSSSKISPGMCYQSIRDLSVPRQVSPTTTLAMNRSTECFRFRCTSPCHHLRHSAGWRKSTQDGLEREHGGRGSQFLIGAGEANPSFPFQGLAPQQARGLRAIGELPEIVTWITNFVQGYDREDVMGQGQGPDVNQQGPRRFAHTNWMQTSRRFSDLREEKRQFAITTVSPNQYFPSTRVQEFLQELDAFGEHTSPK